MKIADQITMTSDGGSVETVVGEGYSVAFLGKDDEIHLVPDQECGPIPWVVTSAEKADRIRDHIRRKYGIPCRTVSVRYVAPIIWDKDIKDLSTFTAEPSAPPPDAG